MDPRRVAAASFLRLSGLPSLGPPRLPAEAEEWLDGSADRLLAGDGAALDELDVPRLDALRWIAERRPVVFHGSRNPELDVLEPIRLTRDTTPFGDQQAVYATTDPVWAIYFATLRRGRGFSTRNGSLGTGATLYPRWYLFSVNGLEGTRFGAGSLYVLPRQGFRPEPPLWGHLDTAHWVSPAAVKPLVRLDVDAGDFPFASLIVSHHEREPMAVTWMRAGLRSRAAGVRARR